MEAIKRDFGSFQKLKERMSAATVAVQGSGWGWLGLDKENGRLRIAACANQDPLQGTTGKRTGIERMYPVYRGGLSQIEPKNGKLIVFNKLIM